MALSAHRLWWLLAEGRTIGEVLSGAVDHRYPRSALATTGMTSPPWASSPD
ncbi:hypothetical protein [Cyanobium sp. Cruz-8H5]|uniref:hypothetical protein n=1 Tax=Cyanobium sp. Cruz-8H5 TaxID=2823712 RepID=UPI0020CE9219|nr:hypothetical protein [Cyanobium sp. Cruz-8H5]MCP9860929.1 hypothetical protein [Cyanobium sp. Cruz-8H5]